MDESILQIFFEEADELLHDFEEGLLRLEQAPDDPEVIPALFRSAHTIKGSSAMMGFHAIAEFTHGLEDLLDEMRRGLRGVTPTVVDALLASRDVLGALVGAAHEGRPLASAEEDAAARVRDTIGGLLHETDAAPVTSRGDTVNPTGEVSPRLEQVSAETANGETSGSSPGWLAEDGESETDSPPPATIPALEAVPPPARAAAAEAPQPRSSATETVSIRVAIDKVDRLINLVGELVITQSMLAQTAADFSVDKLGRLQEAVALMDRHARELHERMMAVRMIPIHTLFGRFPRLVRDLAAGLGKHVALDVSGEETELDRTVLEKMGDPLTHLVRNAVDHGIESPEARRAAGKPETARVALSAYQQGGSIYIEVTDDGRGLSREKILARAVECGFFTADDSPSEADLFALIFRPGFSTAESVTEVSGRGVGLDVVRRNLEALGGTVTIQSERGRGTTFRVKLPLTLAILDGQSLRVGSETFIVPLVSIVESIRPGRDTLQTVLGAAEAVTLRDEVLPVVRLHRVLGVDTTVEDPTEGLMVIVEHESRKVALLADELGDQRQVVIKSLEANFRKVDGVAGATILGDGHVALILDIPGLVALARGEACGRAA
jgi:two-component system, chemotaxis family, sensor kinase CheA